MNKREALLQNYNEYKENVEKVKVAYGKAAKEMEKHFKSQSVTALTAKAILFLESLQKKLYDSEIEKVKKLTIRVVVQDCTGTVRFTDVMLQGGSVATAWVSHVSEQRYTFDAQEV